MTRLRALLIVVCLWAVAFLPGMGGPELKGEEARRILPAVEMLDTGKWLVPWLAGKPYLRKPPLVNWMIAGSFAATGVRNEWTARLPSALCVLALGAGIVLLASGRGWLEPREGLLAAVMCMTTLGLLAKARFAGAEIEGIYVPLAGLGTAAWLAWLAQRRSPWLTWTVPFLALGLALLAKGPMHLLFFYAVVIGTLAPQRRWREMFCLPHVGGLVLMLGVFALWAVPYFLSPEAAAAAKVWQDQFAGRVSENKFDLVGYATNLPRGLVDLLPWLPLAWLAWRQQRDGAVAAVALVTGVVLLVPGVLPRYVMPAGVPLVLAAVAALRWEKIGGVWKKAAFALPVVIGVAALGFSLLQSGRGRQRQLAAEFSSALAGATEPVVVCDADDDAGQLGAFFYLRDVRQRHVGSVEEVPPGAAAVIVHDKKLKKLPKARPELVLAQTFEVEGKDSRWHLFRPKPAGK